MSFWDGRENINKRPSVERRTERVIHHCMEKYSIGIGQAIEKIMKEKLYDELLSELSEIYPDILTAS
ncbi:MAG: hypothetical protein Q8M39_11290 [Sulfuricurvum sp.]|uniref:hypothetical protein n=1 Tax=Sulfuricurvum sp. TaxID=2025608 RepID=UPI00276A984C|nr:hypothetical protein [Sulfuricurvum sp.]MDP3267399.1 hypothetical protein [Sulfuricurvum sp.]HEX5330801.1 hypothetical protein [Sulfuricurvum sp.]